MVAATLGWSTYTCWKRRSSAGSFSMYFLRRGGGGGVEGGVEGAGRGVLRELGAGSWELVSNGGTCASSC
jgi:hypothetical protein